MKDVIYKLLFGSRSHNLPPKRSAYLNFRINLLSIWNNRKHNDIGFEKILRLVLVASQIIFPGIHIRNYFEKKGVITRNVAIEFYVFFKTILPFIFLVSGFYKNIIAVWISFYLLVETLCYVASLIFASDIFVKPRSYRRNILMLFFNYVEISLCFAVVYAGLHLLNEHAKTVFDYVYFSIMTSTSVGYGDICPASSLGKAIASCHAILTVSFIVLFMNFFGSKVEVIHSTDEL